MSARKQRHRVVEAYRDGATLYDVRRRSWEEPLAEVILRSFLTRAEADRWVEDIEGRHDAMVLAVDGA